LLKRSEFFLIDSQLMSQTYGETERARVLENL
jgi:hypothetical protein